MSREATSFPLRQGGLASQQADAVAEVIAAACGASIQPEPFRPVPRGRLLTSGAPLYLQSRPCGQSLASARALWSLPEKVAGRYFAPYLASVRPASAAAAPLAERAPAIPFAARGRHDAVTLAPRRRRVAAQTIGARCRRERLRKAQSPAQRDSTMTPPNVSPRCSHEHHIRTPRC